MAISWLKDLMSWENRRTAERRDVVTEAHNAFLNHSEHVESSALALRNRGDKRNKTSDNIVEAVREKLIRQKRSCRNEDEEWFKNMVQTPFVRRITKVSPLSRVSFPSF